MKAYTDTLRPQMAHRAAARVLGAPGEPGRANGPERLAAREELIRQIAGQSLETASPAMKVALLVQHLVVSVIAVPLGAVGFGMVAVCVTAGFLLATGREPSPALMDVVILGSVVAGGAVALFVLCCRLQFKERRIRRLRALSDAELLREHRRYLRHQAEMAAVQARIEAQQRERDNLDYLARWLGEENFRHQLELERLREMDEVIRGRR